MNFRDFLFIADAMAIETTEAAWRTAVSRAYYAAFHVTCEWMRALGFLVPHADRAHGYLWLRLNNSGQSDLIQAGQKLKDLRGRRNIADYDGHRQVTQAGADLAIQNAKEILAILEQPWVGSLRTQIMETIKIYERDVLKEVTWKP